MKAPLSWLRDHVALPADATTGSVARAIADAGFEVASIDGEVIDFEITANRPDCLSIRGLAREAATALRVRQVHRVQQVQRVQRVQQVQQVQQVPEVEVALESPLCARFALAMADVTVGPSPAWLADRLTACGVRPINNVVDVTNYVMLETGQPMHAYDAARIHGGRLVARLAAPGERLRTLDGVDRTLDATMLVIADGSGAVGIGGVMGGAGSEVSASTSRIALEAAWFQPASVRATSKRLGLKTEASTRFERGADRDGGPPAVALALDLLERIGAGRRASTVADTYPAPLPTPTIALRMARITRLLGGAVPDADVTRILTSLGFTLAPAADGWQVTPPSWRIDVAREADLIEEVGRHWGINRIPAAFPALRTTPRVSDAGVLRGRRLRRLLTGSGLQEAVTFTFMEREAAAPFVADQAGLVEIANPLSEKFAVLRPSLIPGLLDALVYNRRRGLDDVRLFETGAVFTRAGEAQRAGWVMCGARDAHWSHRADPVDLYDGLGVAEILADAWGVTVTPAAATAPGLLPGRTAALSLDARVVGHVGQIDPRLADARGLPAGVSVVAGELDLSVLAGDGTTPRPVSALPRFPSIVRDLSLLVDVALSAADVRATIRQPPCALLHEVREFDRYQGNGVPAGTSSLAFRLTFRHADRTLTDAEVDAAMADILRALRARGVEVRGR